MKYFALAAVAISLAACMREETSTEAVGMANPASDYCVSIGGRSEIRDEEGGQAGYCHLPDGQVVEEWALFRAQNQ